jgi:hypothetical protein
MCRVEETVASVCSASAGELVVREAKCNKAEICVTGERLGEALRNWLGLDNAGNDHNVNSSM